MLRNTRSFASALRSAGALKHAVDPNKQHADIMKGQIKRLKAKGSHAQAEKLEKKLKSLEGYMAGKSEQSDARGGQKERDAAARARRASNAGGNPRSRARQSTDGFNSGRYDTRASGRDRANKFTDPEIRAAKLGLGVLGAGALVGGGGYVLHKNRQRTKYNESRKAYTVVRLKNGKTYKRKMPRKRTIQNTLKVGRTGRKR